MRCPYCSSPALEHHEECLRCGFSLPKLDGWFGAVPRLTPGISDDAALFEPADHKRLEREVAHFRKIFPQISLHIVTANLDSSQNLSLYTFWIFNRSGICNDMAPGAENRNILFMMDAFNQRTCLITGYGLEPFLGEHHLATVGAASNANLQDGRYADGVIAALHCLRATLTDIHEKLDETYGIDTRQVIAADKAALAEPVTSDSLY